MRLPSPRRAHAVPGSEETLGGKRAGIVWRQTVYVEQRGGIMCSPDGVMRSILIIAAGSASAGQLMSCDCIEKPFSNSGLDLKMDLVGFLFLFRPT